MLRYRRKNLLIPKKVFHLVNITTFADKTNDIRCYVFGNLLLSYIKSEVGLMFLPKLKFSIVIKCGCHATGQKFPFTGTSLCLSAKQQNRHKNYA